MSQPYTSGMSPSANGSAHGQRSPTAGTVHRLFTRIQPVDIGFVLAVAARALPGPFDVGCFILLGLIAFAGPRGTLMALIGTWLVASLNPAFFPEPSFGSGARYLVVACAMIAAAARGLPSAGREGFSGLTVSTAALGAALAIHSVAFSEAPGISVQKALLWAAVSLTIVSSARSMDDEQLRLFSNRLSIILAVLIVSGLLVSWHPGARLVNGVGLQGLLDQPQHYGLVCGVGGAFFLGAALGSERPSATTIALVVAAIFGVILSAARSGGFALVLAAAIVIAVGAAQSIADFRARLPGFWNWRLQLVLLLTAVGVLLSASAVSNLFSEFTRKGTSAEDVTAAYDTSRGLWVREMIDNIRERPAQGVGLGIQSGQVMQVERSEITGLATSAPVEKGVMWLAVFEELGLIVGAGFMVWLAALIVQAFRAQARYTAAAVAYLLTNFGEATFLSTGGFGMVGLVVFYVAAATGTRRTLRERGPYEGPMHRSGGDAGARHG